MLLLLLKLLFGVLIAVGVLRGGVVIVLMSFRGEMCVVFRVLSDFFILAISHLLCLRGSGSRRANGASQIFTSFMTGASPILLAALGRRLTSSFY